MSQRTCTRCRSTIEVGKDKIGRVVLPGGICYECWRKTAGHKKKPVRKPVDP